MHDTAMDIGQAFFSSYLGRKTGGKILDLGGMDVNGSLREVAPSGWDYISADLTPGPGVDVVLNDASGLPFATHEFDAVVSSSCFEHNPFFWLTFNKMCRVTREGGYVYINAPSNGAYHRYPQDCWRFYPDAGPALTEWAQRSGHPVTLCESFVASAGKDKWNDFVCVLRKGAAEESISPLHRMVKCSNIHMEGSKEVRLPTAPTQDIIELAEAKKQVAKLTAKLVKISKKNERLTREIHQWASQIAELKSMGGALRRLATSLIAARRNFLQKRATGYLALPDQLRP